MRFIRFHAFNNGTLRAPHLLTHVAGDEVRFASCRYHYGH